jgi:2-polyprenyl-3-methyl-5-hydroxy-6-metoxy-1,4-benzoquinol methylase
MSTHFADERHFIDWNEEMAHKYDPEAYHLRSNFLIRWIERRRVNAILRFLDVDQEDSVLEVGCGAGNVLAQVPARRLNGIDISTFLLKKSQQRLVDQANLAQTNAERLPFVDHAFRRLVCTEVLEHVPDPRQVVAEMARVASADAILVITIPNEAWINRVKGLIRALGLRRWLLQGSEDSYHSPDQMTDEWHLHSFDLALLKEVATGLLVIHKIKAIPFGLFPLRYVACCHVVSNKTWA